jgi:ribosome-binding protein aMBF1 (putative translation factor)
MGLAVERRKRFEADPVAHAAAHSVQDNTRRRVMEHPDNNNRRPRGRAAAALYDRFIAGNPRAEDLYETYGAEADVAQQVYDLRVAARLTQQQLAERIGTTPSVISRLESADYRGHSLSMLRRIAEALGKRVELRFVDAPEEGSSEVAVAG